MQLPERVFLEPITCAKLLAVRAKEWPSTGRWAYVPQGTERIDATTPVTLLAFAEPSSRDFSDDELDAAEQALKSAAKKAGLTRFLTADHLTDVIASLEREIAGAKTTEDARVLKANRDALLYRAITKFWKDDAFLSIYGWSTPRGTVHGSLRECSRTLAAYGSARRGHERQRTVRASR